MIENNVAVPAVHAILPPGAELLYAGAEQETLKKGRLSATPDGLVINAAKNALEQLGIRNNKTGQFVTEFKSFDPRANIKEAKAVHIGQVQVQMGLIHELTAYRPEYAVIIYFNASISLGHPLLCRRARPNRLRSCQAPLGQGLRDHGPQGTSARG